MILSINKKYFILGIIIVFSMVLPSLTTISAQSENENETETSSEQPETNDRVNNRAEMLREAARQRVEANTEARAAQTEERIAARQQACEQRKSVIESRMEVLATRGANLDAKVSSFLSRLESFINDSGVVVADYETLYANVTSVQVQYQESLAVVTELRVDLVCSDPDSVYQAVTAYRESLVELKSDAKDYIESVKRLAQAVKSAAQEQLPSDDETTKNEVEVEAQNA